VRQTVSPQRKEEAIERMGWGVLNKAVLKFAAPFWPTGVDTFGQVG